MCKFGYTVDSVMLIGSIYLTKELQKLIKHELLCATTRNH